ncbi:hypothetical protein BGW80DRAFT_1257232 [Lactifluus volemus]|nr:hypothetical protein BGW80DRAFT_1257232 [Lactifluus volemus]
MGDEPLQNMGGYPYEGVTTSHLYLPIIQCIPNISLTWVLKVGGPQTFTISDTYQDRIFTLPPPTNPPYGASRPVYSQDYEYIPPVHRATDSTHLSMPFNDVVPSQPGGRAHGAVYGPPFPSENPPATSERSARAATRHFNNIDHNPVVPSIMMTNMYRDLAIEFIQSPQSNIVMMHMASAAGRVKVTIELEIDGAV